MKQTKIVRITDVEKDKALLEEAGRIIRDGGIVVFPTETVYGIGANGLDPDCCRSIYEAKGRPSDNPLILTVPDQAGAKKIAASVSPTAQKLLDTFWPGPLTIIFPRKACVPDAATGGLDTVAVRCPDHAIAHAFLQAAGVPVAAPSANLSGRPSPTTAEEVAHDMNGRVDMIIDGGPCHIGVESTIVECNDDGGVTILRPGGVTLDMLQAVVGEVRIDPNMVTGKGVPKAPGMKYRHYAPKAPVTVVRGDPQDTAKYIAAHIGDSTGVLCFDEYKNMFPNCIVECFGSRDDLGAQAREVFDRLRAFDDTSVTQIWAQCPSDEGLGLAVANRIKKAAGVSVVEV